MLGLVLKSKFDAMAAEQARLTAAFNDATNYRIRREAELERELAAAKAAVEGLRAEYARSLDKAAATAEKLQADLDEERLENKILLNRIVQMSGQPALFAHNGPAAEAPPAAAQAVSTLPAPQTRASFDDVHNALRQAMRDGTYSTMRKPN